MPVDERFTAEASALLVVDVQGRLLERIDRAGPILGAIVRLIRAAGLLGIPAVATEQYPRGLGPTVPEVADLVADRHEKMTFHAATPAVVATFARLGVRKVTLVGIEAHVCVAQTALELLRLGLLVQVPGDATSSRHPDDREVALRRIERAGAVVTTSEAAIFEWTETASHPAFKAISGLIKDADPARDR